MRSSATASILPGTSGRRLPFGEEPGGDHDEGRLHELGRLDRHAGDEQPAPRALDLLADEEHRTISARQTTSRTSAARRTWRGVRNDSADHQQRARAARRRRGAARSAGCRARAARRPAGSPRRRARSRSSSSSSDQRDHRPVDGPPPVGKRRAVSAADHATASIGVCVERGDRRGGTPRRAPRNRRTGRRRRRPARAARPARPPVDARRRRPPCAPRCRGRRR